MDKKILLFLKENAKKNKTGYGVMVNIGALGASDSQFKSGCPDKWDSHQFLVKRGWLDLFFLLLLISKEFSFSKRVSGNEHIFACDKFFSI